MIVALSSDAAPAASLTELVDGCVRRGIYSLHLVAGHAHGISTDMPADALADIRAILEGAGVRVVSYEVRAPAGHAIYDAVAGYHAFTHTLVLNAAETNVADGARPHFTGSAPPQHITLRGGGPEAAQHEGRGVGALMARLALANYQGILALAPSHRSVLPVWRAWLQHGRNWGCGSKTADHSLVQLA